MSEASDKALKRGVTPTHELMVDWEIENPGGTLREMGAYFGYSISWLSTMMNSDAYKAYRAGRLKDVHTYVAQDVPVKMRALAELSIERMTEMLEKSADADVIKDSFDKVMHRYGYAPGVQKQNPLSPTYQQNNIFYLTPEQHAKARERLINAHAAVPQLLHPDAVPSDPQPESAPSDDKEKIPTGS
jgi:hypothetical protein